MEGSSEISGVDLLFFEVREVGVSAVVNTFVWGAHSISRHSSTVEELQRFSSLCLGLAHLGQTVGGQRITNIMWRSTSVVPHPHSGVV